MYNIVLSIYRNIWREREQDTHTEREREDGVPGKAG